MMHTDVEGTIDGSTVRPLGSTAHAVLWQFENRHVPGLQGIIGKPEIRNTWRTRGDFWAPFQVQARLAQGLVAAVATTGGIDDEIVGVAEILDPDFLDRRAHFSLVVDRNYIGTGVAIEIALGFLDFVFRSYPIDKIQIEAQSRNARLTPGLYRLLSHEGTFHRHLNIHGEWHDVDSFALWRSDMPRLVSRLLPHERLRREGGVREDVGEVT